VIDVQVPDGSSPEAVVKVLGYIYSKPLDLADEGLLEVLVAANKLLLKELEEKCIKHLAANLNYENVCSILKAARLIGLDALSLSCMIYICANIKEVLLHSGICELPKEDLQQLLEDGQVLADECVMFEGVASWVEANKGSCTAAVAMKEFTPMLRFAAMEHAFLNGRVRQSGLVPIEIVTDAAFAILDHSAFATEPSINPEPGKNWNTCVNPRLANGLLITWTNVHGEPHYSVKDGLQQKSINGYIKGEYNSGAASEQTIIECKEVVQELSWRIDSPPDDNKTEGFVIGLSHEDAGPGHAGINFGIYCQGGGNSNGVSQMCTVNENGVERRFAMCDTFTWKRGDRYAIRVSQEGPGQVTYLKNNKVFYTSESVPVFPLLVDTSFCTAARVSEVRLLRPGW
jgi:hypothetical protein